MRTPIENSTFPNKHSRASPAPSLPRALSIIAILDLKIIRKNMPSRKMRNKWLHFIFLKGRVQTVVSGDASKRCNLCDDILRCTSTAMWMPLPSTASELVTSRDLQRARRMARRTRTVSSCQACRTIRTKCNDYRPCSRCQRLKLTECIEPNEQAAFDNSTYFSVLVIFLNCHYIFVVRGHISHTYITLLYSSNQALKR